MKKRHIAGWLFILIFSAFVFCVGWTGWRVGQGEVGIVTSKTSGVDLSPALPGVFSWHWEFLLPTNASLIIFNAGERVTTQKASGQLPSSTLYASMFDGAADFNYEIEAEFTAHLTAKDILNLFINGTITDEASLSDYIDRRAKECAEYAASILLSIPDGKREVNIDEVQQAIGDNVFTRMRLVKVHLPDRELYEVLKGQYLRRLEEKAIRDESMRKAVSSLLKEYPELEVKGLPPSTGGGYIGGFSTSNSMIEEKTVKDTMKESNMENAAKDEPRKKLCAIRGAACVEGDNIEAVTKCVQEVCREMFKKNALKTKDIVSCFFTVTGDIQSINPATALRAGGNIEGVDTSSIPLFCAQEPKVEGMKPLTIRVMLTAYMNEKDEIKTVYINGAQSLRPDIKQ